MTYRAILDKYSKTSSLLAGVTLATSFAPVWFIPGIYALSLLTYKIYNSSTKKEAFIHGYIFGFGFFVVSFYWIGIAISSYMKNFLFLLPIVTISLPGFLSLFIAGIAILSFFFRKKDFLFHSIFCMLWILFEWLISWIFTGFPWACLGYSFGFSDILIQSANIFGILGISFIVVYLGSFLYSYYNKIVFKTILTTSCIILIVQISYGYKRIYEYQEEFLPTKIRIVQPSIKQEQKWNKEQLDGNLISHVNLSKIAPLDEIDIIIWPESAIILPITNKIVQKHLKDFFESIDKKLFLITGGIDVINFLTKTKIYVSLMGVDNRAKLLFAYYKSHLVPFGEYIPEFILKVVPIKKVTYGSISYSKGSRENVNFKEANLNILPLICYESIFSDEVKSINQNLDVIINLSNDAWYKDSSQPYQHLIINKLRAVENGLPLLRSSNNGISAVINPLGQVLQKLDLHQTGIIDSFIPKKLPYITPFTKSSMLNLFLLILGIKILEISILFIIKSW